MTPSCALDDGTQVDPATASADQAIDDDSTDALVCNGGRVRCHAHVQVSKQTGDIKSFAAPTQGFGPADLQSAYDINPNITIPAAPVVALVDAYGYANLESDLAVYRSTYGLPACTSASGCLKIVNQEGAATPLPVAPPAGDDWTIETALDVDMVSASCPKCKIIVVQADDDQGMGLYIGQAIAKQLGATVISNSWGASEQAGTAGIQATQSSETYFDNQIPTFVSAGDAGYDDIDPKTGKPDGPDYPGTSVHAIAVGGTNLKKDPTTARGWTEVAWTSGGSACSLAIAKPAYQTDSPCKFKATTDVAAVGDPQTGLAIYNAGKFIVVGGTSASSPFVASMFAAAGLATTANLSGAYFQLNAAKLNDVLTGTNGTCVADGAKLCNAGIGWDGPTGFGTPDEGKLVPATVAAPVQTTPPPTTGGDGSTGAGGGTTTPTTDPNGVQGGCSTSSGTTGAGAGLLIGLALMMRRRRK